LFDLNNFDVIIKNTFLDVYEVDILDNKGRLKVCAKCGFKLIHLYVDYNFPLAKMGMNLVGLTNELESPFFLF
jgi:hypothetical protein